MRFLLLLLFSVGSLFGQCSDMGQLFATGTTGPVDNTGSLCTNFTLNVVTQGPIANYTMILQQDSGSGFQTLITCNTVPRCNMSTSISPAPNRLRVNLTVLNSVPAGGYVQWGFAGSVPQPTTGISINTSAPITGGGNVSPGGSVTIACPTCGTGAPSGPAGGDLNGTYPNPGVAQVNGAAVPTSAGMVGTNASKQLISQTPGGDLSGTYPSPTVAKVNGNTPGNTCTNQFTRSINSSAVGTCATVTNSDLTSPTITVNGTACTLGGSCSPSGGTVVSVATPYITVAGTKYVGATLWPFTAFFSGSFADAVTCILTAGTNGSELFNCGINNQNAFYSGTATASVEAELTGGFTTANDLGASNTFMTNGISLCDTTNNLLYTLEFVNTFTTTANKLYFQVTQWTQTACAGTPNTAVVKSQSTINNTLPVLHMKLSKSAGNLSAQVSMDGGQTYSSLAIGTISLGTITKGGLVVRNGGNDPVQMNILSIALN